MLIFKLYSERSRRKKFFNSSLNYNRIGILSHVSRNMGLFYLKEELLSRGKGPIGVNNYDNATLAM